MLNNKKLCDGYRAVDLPLSDRFACLLAVLLIIRKFNFVMQYYVWGTDHPALTEQNSEPSIAEA